LFTVQIFYRKEIEVSKYIFGLLVRSSFHCSQDLNQFHLRRDQWNLQRKKHMFSLNYELRNSNHIYLTSVIEITTIRILYFYKFHSWSPSITFIPNYDLDILYTDMKVNIIVTHLQCFFHLCSWNNPHSFKTSKDILEGILVLNTIINFGTYLK
jgi:hypothetical protein